MGVERIGMRLSPRWRDGSDKGLSASGWPATSKRWRSPWTGGGARTRRNPDGGCSVVVADADRGVGAQVAAGGRSW